MVGIYKITSPSGYVYIGQSRHIENRWRAHKHVSDKSNKYLLNKSLLKYGYINHKFEVVHQLPVDVDKETLTRYEQLYMDQYRECGVVMLNTCPAAGSTSGLKATAETIEKLKKGRARWTITPETGKKISKALKGKEKSEAHKEKLRQANLGKKQTEYTKEKMSASKKGTKKSVEWSAKATQWLREANTGKKLSPEHREKVIATLEKGRNIPCSDEKKIKISEGLKLYFLNKKGKQS